MRLLMPGGVTAQAEGDVAQVAYGDINGGEKVDVQIDLIRTLGFGDADRERYNVTHATSGLVFGESPWRYPRKDARNWLMTSSGYRLTHRQKM